jgi:hypothetical protein
MQVHTHAQQERPIKMKGGDCLRTIIDQNEC